MTSVLWQPTTDGALSQWVIYHRASDIDAAYLVRRWEVRFRASLTPCEGHGADSLEAARALLPPGLVWIGRQPSDDAVIVEVWT